MLGRHLPAGAVVHDHQHVRQGRLLQRGPEGADQRMGQLADESYRIHQQIFRFLRRLHSPGHRVQGGEELILGIDLGSRQGVQQRGLAAVGISHQSHHRRSVLLPVFPADIPLLFHFRQPALQLRHPFPDPPPVHFQLAFSGAPGTDAARQPAQHQPLADQPGALILQLRQLYLQLALGAGCPLGKDIQDQRGPVDHLHPQQILQVSHLDAGQLLVQNAEIRLQGLAFPGQLLRPAPADEESAVRFGPVLQKRPHDLGPGGFRQALQLLQRLRAFDAHQHGLLRPAGDPGGLLRAHQQVALLNLIQPGLIRNLIPPHRLPRQHLGI